MSRRPVIMIAVAFAALLAMGPAAAHADQWTDANLRRAEVNTRLANLKARQEAERLGGKIAAAKATAPQGIRRTRTIHAGLNNQANLLSHQAGR